jgi:hypothetical protein
LIATAMIPDTFIQLFPEPIIRRCSASIDTSSARFSGPLCPIPGRLG